MKENKFNTQPVFRINEAVVANYEQNGSSPIETCSWVEARGLRKKGAFDFNNHSARCSFVYSHDSRISNYQESVVGSDKACAIYYKCGPYIYFESLLLHICYIFSFTGNMGAVQSEEVYCSCLYFRSS